MAADLIVKRRVRICPSCEAPIRQRADWAAIAGVRHHLECARERGLVPRGPGRPTTARGRGARKVTARLSPAEAERIDADSARTGASAGELLRRAYFDPNALSRTGDHVHVLMPVSEADDAHRAATARGLSLAAHVRDLLKRWSRRHPVTEVKP